MSTTCGRPRGERGKGRSHVDARGRVEGESNGRPLTTWCAPRRRFAALQNCAFWVFFSTFPRIFRYRQGLILKSDDEISVFFARLPLHFLKRCPSMSFACSLQIVLTSICNWNCRVCLTPLPKEGCVSSPSFIQDGNCHHLTMGAVAESPLLVKRLGIMLGALV